MKLLFGVDTGCFGARLTSGGRQLYSAAEARSAGHGAVAATARHGDSIGTQEFTFAAQWLAYACPCQSFDDALAGATA